MGRDLSQRLLAIGVLLSGIGWSSGAWAATASQVPFQIPVPCQKDGDFNSNSDIRLHLRPCSESLTPILDSVIERNNTLIECNYLDYRVDLLNQKDLTAAELRAGSQTSMKQKCEQIGVKSYSRPSQKSITCNLFADPPEEDKNHLAEACGELDSSGKALRLPYGDGKWEKAQLAGFRVQARKVTAERIKNEVRQNYTLTIQSPRCETQALRFKEAFDQANEVNSKIISTQVGMGLAALARKNRLCRKDESGVVGDNEAGITQAGCSVSSAGGYLQSAFSQLMMCEVASQTELLYAKIIDEEYAPLSSDLGRCASDAEAEAEDEAWTESEGIRIFKREFNNCARPLMERFINRVRQNYFSARSPARETQSGSPVFAGASFGVLLSVWSSLRERRKRRTSAELRSIGVSVLIALVLSACGDSCSDSTAPKNIMQLVRDEGKVTEQGERYGSGEVDQGNAMDSYNCLVIEPFVRGDECPEEGVIFTDDFTIKKLARLGPTNRGLEYYDQTLEGDACQENLPGTLGWADVCLDRDRRSKLKDVALEQVKGQRLTAAKGAMNAKTEVLQGILTDCADPTDFSQPNPRFQNDAEGLYRAECVKCFGEPDPNHPEPFQCPAASDSTGSEDPIMDLAASSISGVLASVAATQKFVSGASGATVMGTDGDALSDSTAPNTAAAESGAVTATSSQSKNSGEPTDVKAQRSQEQGKGALGGFGGSIESAVGKLGGLFGFSATERSQDPVSAESSAASAGASASSAGGESGELSAQKRRSGSDGYAGSETVSIETDRISEFGATEGSEDSADPMGSEDPDDYFERNPYESLFRRVEKVYHAKERDFTLVGAR